jgi:hypothetical protein
MAKAPTYRIVKRKTPPKKMKKYYVCDACHGTVHAANRQTIEAVTEVHTGSCPAALRISSKKK